MAAYRTVPIPGTRKSRVVSPIGPGRGEDPSGTSEREPGEAGYARVQEQRKREIERQLQMSFGTLEQAQAELKRREKELAIK